VSYDLAVWDGPLPSSDSDAAAEFARLMDAAEGGSMPATPKIRTLIDALTDRWPDGEESSPWSTSPLLAEANGNLIYIPMSFGQATEGVIAVANEAARLSLICFDPQDEVMLN
jgi:hypothetical protein